MGFSKLLLLKPLIITFFASFLVAAFMIIAYERRDESSEYVDNSGFNSYVFRSTNEIRFKYLKEGKTEMRERQKHTIITH